MSNARPRSAIADLKSAFGVTVLLLTFVGAGVPGVVAKLTNADDVAKLGEVLALTLPLSLWIGITVFIFLATHWPGISQFIFAVISLTVLTLVGNAIGAGTGVSLRALWDTAHGRWQDFFGLLVTDYAFFYGATTFLSALIVGGFLGYAWWRLLASTPPPAPRDRGPDTQAE